MQHGVIILLAVFSLAITGLGGEARLEPPAAANPYARWADRVPGGAGFFPIAVWLQNPGKAAQYRAAGINTYVGLWKGPTEEQLAALTGAGMKLICEQNAVALRHLNDATIIGWMHGDEPDNAQSLGEGKGYGPPILPAKIVQDYERIRSADPSRPVMLNLGQGVAWDNWHGRGVRTNHPEDYAQYAKGCDIASFDIYPVAESSPQVSGKLWLVAHGVSRLLQWTAGEKIVWNCIECTRISNPKSKATPEQVRCEVWMSLIHGSMGLIYFVHEWQPRFNESALLSDPEMLAAVTRINGQIHALAPVLNSPTLKDAAVVDSSSQTAPIAAMVKRHQGALYVFAAAMRDGEATATISIQGLKGEKEVAVLGEDRMLLAKDGVYRDSFKPWSVHLYRVAAE
jgi:hypothetical protein